MTRSLTINCSAVIHHNDTAVTISSCCISRHHGVTRVAINRTAVFHHNDAAATVFLLHFETRCMHFETRYKSCYLTSIVCPGDGKESVRRGGVGVLFLVVKLCADRTLLYRKDRHECRSCTHTVIDKLYYNKSSTMWGLSKSLFRLYDGWSN
jgi:hypothetical protein